VVVTDGMSSADTTARKLRVGNHLARAEHSLFD
jgi:hypothetical protein